MKLFDDQLIVVTGGAGFIGSCIVRYLNDQGHTNIVIVDDLGTSEKWKNLVGKTYLDIVSIKEFFQWLVGREAAIEAFIHLGANSSTTETDADHLLDNNFRFSKTLTQYALKNDQRFIYASSAATYGDGAQGFSDDHTRLQMLRPQNMYGYSKQLFDLWLKNNNLLDKVVGLKYFNVFGPNELHKKGMASAITRMVPSVQKEGIIKLFKSNDPTRYPDGGQMRDFIYVKDAVRMTCAFLTNDATGIFNIGNGKPNSWNELASAVFKALGIPPKIEYIDIPKEIIGYQNYTAADMGKSSRVLGKAAECMPLEEAVRDYVSGYLLQHKTW
jgi:ADP-L-glycero-D-manno-heptose 6-epimerase